MSLARSHSPLKGVRLHASLPSKSKIKQIDGLQIMRAVAVILVAWGHAGLEFHQRLPDLGIFGIDLFFVISGFIMASIVLHSRESPGWPTTLDFMMRRFIRIYPIYWIYAAICTIRIWHNGYLFRQNFWFSVPLLPMPHHWRIVDFSWTMMFEIMFYCILGFLLLFTVRRAVPLLIVLLTSMVCLSRFVDISEERWGVVANPILLEFVFGAVIAVFFYRYQRLRAAGILLLCCGTAYAFYIRMHPSAAAWGMQPILFGDAYHVLLRAATWGLAAALIVGGMVFWSPEVRSWPGKLGVVIGNASYSIYLGSALVMEFGNRAMQRLHHVEATSPLWLIATYQIAVVLMVIVSGWLSYQFVEWPLVRSLQRRYAERRKHQVAAAGQLEKKPVES